MVEMISSALIGVLIGGAVVFVISKRRFNSYLKQKEEEDRWEWHNEYDSHGGVWRVGTEKKK